MEPISKFIAQLLINTGSKEITTVDPKAVAAAPLSSDINVSSTQTTSRTSVNRTSCAGRGSVEPARFGPPRRF